MPRFVFPSLVGVSLLVALSSSASAQIGQPSAALERSPALSAYVRSGNTLTAPSGVRITLSKRGPYLAGASVTLPSFDTAAAGQLLGLLTGYGEALSQPYAQYLNSPQTKPQLTAGTSVAAEQYRVTTKRVGQGLNFSVKLDEVPASAFQPVQTAFGPANASVVLRLYSDFQCPYCERFETQTWPALKAALGQDVRFEFHQLPLEQLHPNARAAAEASQCAAAQGQFWAYKDALFDPKAWAVWTVAANPNPNFLALASTLKLNADQFKTCLAGRDGKAVVDAGLKEAAAVGVNGTPSLYVGGYKVVNTSNLAGILQLIQFVRAK